MNATSKISKIKELLGLEVNFETKKLENGTTFESEKFEAGSDVFILTEDEKIPVPVGTYSMEDGVELTVDKEGVIASLGKKDEEDYGKHKEDEEEEMRDDGKEAAVDDWEGMEKRIKNLEDAVADLKGRMEAETEEEEADEAKDMVDEEKEELSVQPFKHNPEKQNNKTKLTTWGNNRIRTTKDRVYNQIFNS